MRVVQGEGGLWHSSQAEKIAIVNHGSHGYQNLNFPKIHEKASKGGSSSGIKAMY